MMNSNENDAENETKSREYNINIPWLRYGHKYTNKKHVPQYNDNFMY